MSKDNGNSQPQGTNEETQSNEETRQEKVDILETIQTAAVYGKSVWDSMPAGNHAITVGGKTFGITKPGNYTGRTSQKEINSCLKEYMGDEAAEVVDNNMSISANFIPKKGASHHFFATVGTAAVASIASFFGGKAIANKASQNSEIATSDNVESFGNESYSHLNFGS